MDLIKSVPEAYHTAMSKLAKPIAIATLGAATVACKASDMLTSPDPVFSFARGAAGTVLLEAELGAGKLVDYILTKNQSCGLGLLGMAALAIPPVAVGIVSIDYPAVGYAALALPVLAAFAYLMKRD